MFKWKVSSLRWWWVPRSLEAEEEHRSLLPFGSFILIWTRSERMGHEQIVCACHQIELSATRSTTCNSEVDLHHRQQQISRDVLSRTFSFIFSYGNRLDKLNIHRDELKMKQKLRPCHILWGKERQCRDVHGCVDEILTTMSWCDRLFRRKILREMFRRNGTDRIAFRAN